MAPARCSRHKRRVVPICYQTTLNLEEYTAASHWNTLEYTAASHWKILPPNIPDRLPFVINTIVRDFGVVRVSDVS